MNEIPNPADYVAVEIAGKAAGIPSRTLRYWIKTGKLAAIAGQRGKLVSMGEVAQLARMTGKVVGNANTPDSNMATSAEGLTGNITDPAEAGALVSDLARQQLATIRDEWLAPLIGRMGELERENGRLAAERDGATSQLLAQAETIAALRRRVGVAEAEVVRRRQDREAAQAASAGRHAEEAPAEGQGDAPGVWEWLRRWWTR